MNTDNHFLFTRKNSIYLIIFTLFIAFLFCCKSFGMNTDPSNTIVDASDSSPVQNPDSPYILTTLNSSENITPGLFSEETISTSAPGDNEGKHPDSLLASPKDLIYYFESTDYCYGITKDGREVFAHLDTDGTKTDVLNGGGTITVWDTSDRALCQAEYICNLEILETSPVESIRVTYANSMPGSTCTTTYRFHENYVKATTAIHDFRTTRPIGVAFLQRVYPNGYKQVDQKMNSNWVFPDNNDFPYKEFDCYTTIHSVDNSHRLYTFYHGESANIKEFYEYYNKDHFIIKTIGNQLTSHQLDYELVFENPEKDKDCDYFALFKSKGQSLAFGITPTNNNSCQSSVFTDSDTELNMNISNMATTASKGILTFHLYDYYGKDLLSDTYSFSLDGQTECNRTLKLSEITQGKTGIYYLDAKLTSDNYTYRELYPFALLENHSYFYRNSNPFGISGMRFGKHEANDTTIYLADVLGMSHARVGISIPEYVSSDYTLLKTYLQKLNKAGIQVSGQFILMDDWTYPTDPLSYERKLSESLAETAPYLSAMEIGNEQNMIDISYNHFESKEAAMKYYRNTQFNPGVKVINKLNLPVISAGVGLSDSNWLTLLAETGVLDASDILSTHAYSYPHSPEFTKDASIEHSFESSLVRVRSFLDIVGDRTWYLSEMGLPTTPLLTENTFSGVDLRTQADYTIREFLLALSYGADVVESYSFYDQVNLFKGIDNENNEYNFGMFYDQDYFGRIFPKPYAVAYSTMTRQMDGVKEVKELVSRSATLRIFQITLANDKTILAAYSTANRLSNDAVIGKRTPNLPWNLQWNGYETLTLQTAENADQVYTLDLMGNKKIYNKNKTGTVSIPVNGSPIFIHGASYK